MCSVILGRDRHPLDRDTNPRGAEPPHRFGPPWFQVCRTGSVDRLNRLCVLLVSSSQRISFLLGASRSRPDYCWVQSFRCCWHRLTDHQRLPVLPPSSLHSPLMSSLPFCRPFYFFSFPFFNQTMARADTFAVNLDPKPAPLVPRSHLFPRSSALSVGSSFSSSPPPGDLSVSAHVECF